MEQESLLPILELLAGKDVFIQFMLETGQAPLNGRLQRTDIEGIYSVRAHTRDNQTGQDLGDINFYFCAKEVATVAEKCAISMSS